MSNGASYQQVAEFGLITINRRLQFPETYTAEICNKFAESMTHLARRMAQTRIKDQKKINRPLMGVLIQAFKKVEYETCLTQDQINSKCKRQENMVFVLKDKQQPNAVSNTVEKPHKGNLVLCRDTTANTLYVPHPDAPLPFILTAENIQNIPGGLGKEIRKAFHEGSNNLKTAQAPKKLRTREDAANVAAALTPDQIPLFIRRNAKLLHTATA